MRFSHLLAVTLVLTTGCSKTVITDSDPKAVTSTGAASPGGSRMPLGPRSPNGPGHAAGEIPSSGDSDLTSPLLIPHNPSGSTDPAGSPSASLPPSACKILGMIPTNPSNQIPGQKGPQSPYPDKNKKGIVSFSTETSASGSATGIAAWYTQVLTELRAIAYQSQPSASELEQGCAKTLWKVAADHFRSLESLSKSLTDQHPSAVPLLLQLRGALLYADLVNPTLPIGSSYQVPSFASKDLLERALETAKRIRMHLTLQLSLILHVGTTEVYALVNPADQERTQARVTIKPEWIGIFAYAISHNLRIVSETKPASYGAGDIADLKDSVTHAKTSLSLVAGLDRGSCASELVFNKSNSELKDITICDIEDEKTFQTIVRTCELALQKY